jgi:hypothetical protein
VLFKKFWWLLLLCFVLDILHSSIIFQQTGLLRVIIYLVWFAVWVLLALIIFLIIRPSIARKDRYYFLSYLIYFTQFAAITALARTLRVWASSYSNIPLIITILATLLFLHITPSVSTMYLSPFLVFLALFILDEPSTLGYFLKSIIRALKMVIYNYPWCLIIFLASLYGFILIKTVIVFPVIYYSVLFFIKNIGPELSSFIWQLAEDAAKIALIIPICTMANFYTTKIHEQFSLYYQG